MESDSDTTALLVAALSALVVIDGQITELMDLSYVTKVEGVGDLTPAQGLRLLRQQGRIKIRTIADALDLLPMADYYSAKPNHSASEFI